SPPTLAAPPFDRPWPRPTVKISTVLVSSLAVVLSAASHAAAFAQQGAPDGTWPSYHGDLGATQYSALDQIHGGNLDRVSVAWTWSSPDNELAAENAALAAGGFKGTPIMVDGVLYVRTSLSVVAAVDAASGRQLWVFDPESYAAGRPANLGYNTRGVAHWSGGDRSVIFVATGDSHLWALDAQSGQPIPQFGNRGSVDLVEGLGRETPRGAYTVMSPPLVVGDLVIVGSSINDVPMRMTAPPGDVRAFDARTGREVWSFRTIPLPGELGHDTWEGGSDAYTGNTNVWTVMSADPELGLVYLPTGTPTNDWYGGHRLGDNLFAESIVALEAATGRYRWHYQVVHHGVWDYDLPAAPTLMDVVVDGRPVKALAQITKQGFVFVLDRETGEPIWPIVERPVPQSTVPGEKTSPTQPFPTKPAPFESQGISPDDLIDYTPELRAEAEAILYESDFGPLYTPPSLRGTLNNPGWFGGANWYGAAADPETGMLYIPSRTSPIKVRLVEPDPERSDFRYVRGPDQSARGPQGLPLIKGPHLRLTAINMNSGEHAWQVPLGDGIRQRLIGMGVADPGPQGGGAFTGPLLTKTLLFVGHMGARDGDASPAPALLAIDKATGRTLGAVELPGMPNGTPMTYTVDGRQMIVIAVNLEREAALVAVALE
ncbi:MAG TPA: pyrroloquinoline quinone-dependent dehydrogenase, partial [Longimicrobiales bacterium]|nr:pyrroloquinoline quinone-dependent dehydrogenase [Longimicrobiales bacterium]